MIPRLVAFLLVATLSAVPVRVFTIGDSTVANYAPFQAPQCGWGQVLGDALGSGFTVTNFARGGRSSKSFYEEGLWSPALSNLSKGDWVLIQFGHNDWFKAKDPVIGAPAATTYREYLTRYAQESRAKGARPVFVTPVSRCQFGKDGTVKAPNPEYPAAMKALALELGIPCIDLDASSRALLEGIGLEEAKNLYMIFEPGAYANHPKGKNDSVHLRKDGAIRMAHLVAGELQNIVQEAR